MPKKEDPIIRFHRKYKIDLETGCWLWIGSFFNSGYPRFKLNKKDLYSHRFSYETFVGSLNPNLEICHCCNNKACVNPNHLRQDTSSSNSIDRCYDFSQNGQKLTSQQVKEIKIELQNSYRGLNKILSIKYGVDSSTITAIKIGKSWSHLKI